MLITSPDKRGTYGFGAGSRYLHSTFFSLQFLHGLVSSHFALSARQLSQACKNQDWVRSESKWLFPSGDTTLCIV